MARKILKKTYAKRIAAQIENAEVSVVEKANGVVLTGITVKNETNIAPTIYIDDMYDKDVPVVKAVEKIKEITEKNRVSIDVDAMLDYEKVKPNLRARLYNAKTNHLEIFRSAEEYGFSDLVIAPYLNEDLGDPTQNASVKVSKGLLKEWGVTEDEVFETAMENSRKEFKIETMLETMAQMMGMTVDDIPKFMKPDPDEPEMWVLSNRTKSYGAIGVITNADQLGKQFPNGYVVIPSSVHEVLILPMVTGKEDALNNMVNEVNATEVQPEEVLSDHVYFFG